MATDDAFAPPDSETPPSAQGHHAQLLFQPNFGPLFVTQFLGAFNDNFFKNALVILVTFRNVTVAGVAPEAMVALSAAVFILPYFLFSALAGQLADKLDKADMIRATKTAEIGVMLLCAAGFVLGSVPVLLAVLFLMGTQSTVFGPCKYGILPQHLAEGDLVTGNAFIELGTYLAILLGTLAGGVLINMPYGEYIVAAGVLIIAGLGRLASQWVPAAPAQNPDLEVRWEPVGPTLELIRLCREERSIFLSILGISWFWLFGSAFLALFPPYTKVVLGGTEGLATLFLALFSVGIGVGSMLCERLSRDRLELGLVPIGSFGMSVFTADLWWVGAPWATGDAPIALVEIVTRPAAWRIFIDLVGLAVFGGFLIVPLYTLIQQRARAEVRARIIAGNNVINAFFMVLGSLALAGLQQGIGLDPVTIFGVLSVANVLVAIYIYTVVPEFLLRFVAWMLSVLVYRVKVHGHELIPDEGPCVVVANHVSFIDWFVLMASIKRPARFVMYRGFYDLPVVRFLFQQAKCIPIASAKEDPEALERSFERISEELRDGQVVVIFPEGRITHTGDMQGFRPGIERILETDPVPVVPVALNGLWGSYFSRKEGAAMTQPFRRGIWSRVHVTVGAGVQAAEANAQVLEERVRGLWQARPQHP